MRIGGGLVLVTGLCASAPASSQTFIDVFAGRSLPEKTDIRIVADEARVNGDRVPAALRVDLFDVEPTNENLLGARLGHWFGNFGLAVDVSSLNPDVKAQRVAVTASVAFDESVFGERVVVDAGDTVDVSIPRVGVPTTVTVAGLAMARLPIGATVDRPGGIVSPYAFAGPVWLVTNKSLNGKFGIRAGGGVRLPITRGLGVFAEYRYTRVESAKAIAGRIGGQVGDTRATTGDIRVELDLRNHTGAAGISLQF